METSSSDCLTICITTLDDIYKRFGKLSKKDHVDYTTGKQKIWFLFGEEPIGHGSITKIGRGDFPSNHWRGGGIWIHPDCRSQRIGIKYISVMLRYMMSLMPGPYKNIYGRSWKGSQLTLHYLKMGWKTGREYKGGFIDIHKMYHDDGNLLSQVNGLSSGIVEPNDLYWSFPKVKNLCI